MFGFERHLDTHTYTHGVDPEKWQRTTHTSMDGDCDHEEYNTPTRCDDVRYKDDNDDDKDEHGDHIHAPLYVCGCVSSVSLELREG